MPKVIHFEIPSKEPEKSVEFYKNVFDWIITKWDAPVDYWLTDTKDIHEHGINGAIFRPEKGEMSVINTIGVDNLEKYMERVKANGGQLLTLKMTVPGVGYMAYCKDNQGIQFGLMQEDPNA